MKFKVGDVIVDRDGDVADTLKIMMTGNSGSSGQYVVQYDTNHLTVMGASYIEREYKLKPEFFELGKTYRFRGLDPTPATYYIKELYQVDRPTDSNSEGLYAVALVNVRDGGQRITILNPLHFSDMEEDA